MEYHGDFMGRSTMHGDLMEGFHGVKINPCEFVDLLIEKADVSLPC